MKELKQNKKNYLHLTLPAQWHRRLEDRNLE